MAVTKKKIFSNLIWRFLERTGAQLVSLIVSIILARILTPEDYGKIALITVFINILNVFVDSGLGTALIQKKDADNIDFSTVFYTNIFLCIFLYILICLSAPTIAKFYDDEQLTPIIRVLGITVLISGVKNIQQAFVSKTLQFRKFFFATSAGTLVAATVGITMAYKGFGVWALVIQQITNLSIDTIVLWMAVKWRPNFVFSIKRLKELFSYGWKLLISSLLDTGYNNLRNLIIGKKYSSIDLAFYTKGELFPKAVVANLNNAIDSVLLPSMSEEQNNKLIVKQMTRRAIKIGTYFISPLMLGLAACAPSVITLLLTEKWLPSVPYMVIFCITYMFWPIHSANLNAIKAIGRSDIFLRLEIIKKIIGIIILIISMWFGVLIMACSLLLISMLSQIINSWPNKKLLDYGYKEQMEDIIPGVLLSFFMGGIVFLINFISMPVIFKLLLQLLLGISLYIIGSILFKLDSFEYIIKILKNKSINK